MDNSTEEASLDISEFLAFSSVILSLSILAIIFNVVTAIVLGLEAGTLIALRIILVNLLVGDIVTAVAVFMQNSESVILSAAKLNQNNSTVQSVLPVEPVCRIFIWLHHVSFVVRLSSLATYSVAVLLYIRRGQSRVTPAWSSVAIIITWIVALVLCVDRLVPEITAYDHVDGVRCLPISGQLQAVRITLLVAWVVFGGFMPSAVCITALIVSACDLKKRTSLEGKTYKKALVRLSFFLFLANTFNTVWIVLPPTLAILAENVDTALARQVISYAISVITMMSIITTPVLILVFLKKVRLKLLTLLCWCKDCCRINNKRKRPDLQLQLLAR